MKKLLLILLSIFSFFIASCSESSPADDKGCKDECKAYEICNEDTGNCELSPGMCASADDCSADKPVCDANECIAESTDCSVECDSNFQICSEGSCVTKDGFCSTSDDCETDKPICSAGHQCVADNNGDTVTIKELKDSGIEWNKYTTNGIVTTKDKDGFFMQDNSNRGIYVYMNLKPGEFMEAEIGDRVTVTGAYKIHYGFNELTYFIDEERPENNINLEINVDTKNNPLPDFIEVDAGIKTLENFESMLVTLKNPNFRIKKKMIDSGNRDFILTDSNETKFTANDYLYNLESMEGQVLSKIQGVLKFHKEEYKIVPRDSNDVAKATLTCDPVCETYEECVYEGNNTVCQLAEGMCETQADCSETQECLDHVCTTPPEVNLVPNAGLENWLVELPNGAELEDSKAEGWIFGYQNQAATTATKESTTVFEGSFSAKLKKVAAENNNTNKKNEFLSPAFPVDTTKQYSISMKVFDNDPNVKVRLFFKFYDEAGYSNGMGNMNNSFSVDSHEWREYKHPDNWNIYAGIDAGNESGQLGTIKTMRVGVRLHHGEPSTTYDDQGNAIYSDGTKAGYIYLDDVKVIEKR